MRIISDNNLISYNLLKIERFQYTKTFVEEPKLNSLPLNKSLLFHGLINLVLTVPLLRIVDVLEVGFTMLSTNSCLCVYPHLLVVTMIDVFIFFCHTFHPHLL